VALNSLPPHLRASIAHPNFALTASAVLATLLTDIGAAFSIGEAEWVTEGVDYGGVTDSSKTQSSIFGGAAAALSASRGGARSHRTRETFPQPPPPASDFERGALPQATLLEMVGFEGLGDLEEEELASLRNRRQGEAPAPLYCSAATPTTLTD